MKKNLIPIFIAFICQLANVIWYWNTSNPRTIVIGFNLAVLIWIIYVFYYIWKLNRNQ